MKTAAEWVEIWAQGPTYRTRSEFVAWVQKVLDDARAGMVDDGELRAAVAVQHSLQARLDEETAWAAKWKKERDEARAELAQAWEAGRTAAADIVCLQICGCVDRIRALQPPGGKAK